VDLVVEKLLSDCCFRDQVSGDDAVLESERLMDTMVEGENATELQIATLKMLNTQQNDGRTIL